MTTNPYFNNGHINKAYMEQDTINLLTQEVIQMYGQNMVYCPRTLVKEDKLLGEDVLSAFNQKYSIETYIQNVNQFGGQGDFLGKFGVQVNDTIELIISRTRFNLITNLDHPVEGDLFYFPMSKTLFEIKFVEHENPFYQLGQLYTFKLSCEIFNYSHEDFNTGIEDIDMIDKILDNEPDFSVVRDDYANNKDIKDLGDDATDFSESHPFGNRIDNN